MATEKHVEKLTLSAEVGGIEDPHSTAPSVLTLDDKIVRGTCQNALVIAVAMLGEASHRHLISVIVNCVKPVEAWHSTQNKELRSEKGSASWILDQLEGDFMTHVNAIMYWFLEECGILQQYDGLSLIHI